MKTVELLELIDRYSFLSDEANNLKMFELPEDEKAAIIKEILSLSGKENVFFETSKEDSRFTKAIITSPTKELKITLVIHISDEQAKTVDQFAKAVDYCLMDFDLGALKEKYKLGNFGI